MEHTLFSALGFKVEEEVIVKGSYTEDGKKYTFGGLGIVQKKRWTPKRGWCYAVKLDNGTIKLFYQKSAQKYKPTFIISSIL